MCIIRLIQKSALHQVRERCHKEWSMFKERLANAEKDYFKQQIKGFVYPPN